MFWYTANKLVHMTEIVKVSNESISYSSSKLLIFTILLTLAATSTTPMLVTLFYTTKIYSTSYCITVWHSCVSMSNIILQTATQNKYRLQFNLLRKSYKRLCCRTITLRKSYICGLSASFNFSSFLLEIYYVVHTK